MRIVSCHLRTTPLGTRETLLLCFFSLTFSPFFVCPKKMRVKNVKFNKNSNVLNCVFSKMKPLRPLAEPQYQPVSNVAAHAQKCGTRFKFCLSSTCETSQNSSPKLKIVFWFLFIGTSCHTKYANHGVMFSFTPREKKNCRSIGSNPKRDLVHFQACLKLFSSFQTHF